MQSLLKYQCHISKIQNKHFKNLYGTINNPEQPDRWNRTEIPEINSSLYGQLIFDKRGRSIKWSKNNLFNKGCWEICNGICKKMKVNHQLTPYTRINTKWINSSLYGQLIFDKGGRSIQWRKNSLFNKWCWDIWTATCKK